MKISKSRVIVSGLVLAALVVAATMPQVLGTRVERALDALQGANRDWLALAVAGFAAGFMACVCAWRVALTAAGGRISLPRATASLGVGALVNTFTPARLGDVVKIALFSRSLDGPDRVWTASGTYAAVSAARCLSIAALVVAGSLAGALPLWPVFALCGGVVVVGAVALSSPRWRRHHRIAHLLDGFAALVRAPRFGVRVLAWSALVAIMRLAAVAALAAALGLHHPFVAALLICPALDLAGTVPLTPGNVGVASGAVAVALASRGIGVADALGVGIGIQALETLVSLGAGALGALYFAASTTAGRRWVPRVALVGLPAAIAALVGALFVDLT
jgi:uncharacterized membrane protein YbhN (UPF0104 family)